MVVMLKCYCKWCYFDKVPVIIQPGQAKGSVGYHLVMEEGWHERRNANWVLMHMHYTQDFNNVQECNY